MMPMGLKERLKLKVTTGKQRVLESPSIDQAISSTLGMNDKDRLINKRNSS
jgi:hypothetical protein